MTSDAPLEPITVGLTIFQVPHPVAVRYRELLQLKDSLIRELARQQFELNTLRAQLLVEQNHNANEPTKPNATDAGAV